MYFNYMVTFMRAGKCDIFTENKLCVYKQIHKPRPLSRLFNQNQAPCTLR